MVKLQYVHMVIVIGFILFIIGMFYNRRKNAEGDVTDAKKWKKVLLAGLGVIAAGCVASFYLQTAGTKYISNN